MIWEEWQPYAGGALLIIAVVALLWSWWPTIKQGKAPKTLVAFGSLAALILLLAAAWKIGADSGFAEAQRIAKESLGAATIAQKDHGFSLGDAVNLAPDGTWRKALSDMERGGPASAVIGQVEGDKVSLVRSGFVAIRHSLGKPGDAVFLSQTVPGGLTTEVPTKGVGQPLGMVVNSNLLLVDIEEVKDLSFWIFSQQPSVDPGQ